MIWTVLYASLALADEFSHTYEADEAVLIWFNKVAAWPVSFNSHSFSWIPLCSAESTHPLGVGEMVEGFAMQDSHMDVRFLREVKRRYLCSVPLSAASFSRLREAVQERFWMQLFVDNLPMWGPLGKVTAIDNSISVYSHFNFQFHYNNNQLIQVLCKPEDPVKLESAEQSLNFSYSLTWLSTSVPFEARLSIYSDPGFFPTFGHWLTAGNATVMAMFVIFLVRVILGRLIMHQELLEYDQSRLRTSGALAADLAAFKQMAGEVFRPPSCLLLLTVCVSAGTQLLGVALSMLLLFLLYPMYIESGNLLSMLIVVYSLFGLLGGLRCGSFYSQQGGRYWIATLLISLLGVPLLVGGVVLGLHAFSPALPWLSPVEGRVFLSLGVPLHVGGAVIGRKCLADPKYPCKVNTWQPLLRYQKRWYQEPSVLILLAGLPLFGITHMAVESLFWNVWEYKLYCVYGFGLIVFVMLVLISGGTAIIITYYLLTVEDYRWPWVSFLGAGSSVGYMFVFIMNCLESRTQWSGGLEESVRFGYIGLACLCFFLVFGAVGHLAASLFLRHVYTYLKRV